MKLRFLVLLLSAPALFAGTAPATPVIIEPGTEGLVVHAADVHMATAPFRDDDGDGHRCTDWEIVWTDQPAWRALCVDGPKRIHIHLGDGRFLTHLQGLRGGYEYRLRVRHRDDSGDPETEWSEWSERTFQTAPPEPLNPMLLQDVLPSPRPGWVSASGAEVALPAGTSMRLEAADAVPLFEIRGFSSGPVVLDHGPLPASAAVRLVLTAGATGWGIVQSEIAIFDDGGRERTIYLPTVIVEPLEPVVLWVSANGSTHVGEAAQRAPDFSRIARGAPLPWSAQPGFRVERAASDLRLPVGIAFLTDPPDGDDAPFFYVAELYGDIKVVSRGGQVSTYAGDLLTFTPSHDFPGSGEIGLAGITVDPESGDVIATLVYAGEEGVLLPKIIRLSSQDGGRTASRIETILTLPGAEQAPSHQISAVNIGPDRKIYVHLGDSARPETALDLTTALGKILRLNPDGTAPADNPFYDPANGITDTDYIFAYGLRNPFGGTWRWRDQSLYEVENGPETDRLAKVVKGRNFLWDGSNESMKNFAICTFPHGTAPVNLAFVQPETFGGSGFPTGKLDHLFISESGPTWASGTPAVGKRISELVIGVDETLESGPEPLVWYDGTGKATVVALAAGPDGLYFTDLYRDFGYVLPTDPGARVFRVRWVGVADFSASVSRSDPLTVELSDRSTVVGALSWSWDFGDGTTGVGSEIRHRYERQGTYLVRLVIVGAHGTIRSTKRLDISSGGSGLVAEYFAGPDLTDPRGRGTASEIDVHWTGAPGPGLPADSFSIRWTGRVMPRLSETHRLIARTTDAVRVMVGGREVISPSTPVVGGERTGEILLRAGVLEDIVVELFHGTGDAALQLLWESPSQSKEVVPPANLFAPRSVRRRAAGK